MSRIDGKPVHNLDQEKPAKRKSGVGGASVGAAMAGLEQAISRTTPPPIEMAHEHRHEGAVVTGDGTMLTITLPPDGSKSDKPEISDR